MRWGCGEHAVEVREGKWSIAAWWWWRTAQNATHIPHDWQDHLSITGQVLGLHTYMYMYIQHNVIHTCHIRRNATRLHSNEREKICWYIIIKIAEVIGDNVLMAVTFTKQTSLTSYIYFFPAFNPLLNHVSTMSCVHTLYKRDNHVRLHSVTCCTVVTACVRASPAREKEALFDRQLDMSNTVYNGEHNATVDLVHKRWLEALLVANVLMHVHVCSKTDLSGFNSKVTMLSIVQPHCVCICIQHIEDIVTNHGRYFAYLRSSIQGIINNIMVINFSPDRYRYVHAPIYTCTCYTQKSKFEMATI